MTFTVIGTQALSVALVLLISLAVATVLWGEVRGVPWLRWVAKPLASAGFIALAWGLGAIESTYGRVVLIALALSWLGDVLLLGEARSAFLAGLVSFLLGHAAFAVAFVVLGISLGWSVAALAALLVPVVVVVRWLLPHLRGPMRVAVPAYIAVITAMVALAAGAVGAGGARLILVSAVAFFLSDLAVARERFVTQSVANRMWGLPLYYAAQVGFAFTVVM